MRAKYAEKEFNPLRNGPCFVFKEMIIPFYSCLLTSGLSEPTKPLLHVSKCRMAAKMNRVYGLSIREDTMKRFLAAYSIWSAYVQLRSSSFLLYWGCISIIMFRYDKLISL